MVGKTKLTDVLLEGLERGKLGEEDGVERVEGEPCGRVGRSVRAVAQCEQPAATGVVR